MTQFKDLEGQTLFEILVGGDEIRFITTDGKVYIMHHHQDCCENVRVEEVIGDINDLLRSPILLADESSSRESGIIAPEGLSQEEADLYRRSLIKILGNDNDNEYSSESSTWTFYRLRTIKGSVDIRWYGSSNGYYSESVDFELMTECWRGS